MFLEATWKCFATAFIQDIFIIIISQSQKTTSPELKNGKPTYWIMGVTSLKKLDQKLNSHLSGLVWGFLLWTGQEYFQGPVQSSNSKASFQANSTCNFLSLKPFMAQSKDISGNVLPELNLWVT